MIRECGNCLFSRGIGSDVWCEHEPPGKTTYMARQDTDCPYYEPIPIYAKLKSTDITEPNMEGGKDLEILDPVMIERYYVDESMKPEYLDNYSIKVPQDRKSYFIKDRLSHKTICAFSTDDSNLNYELAKLSLDYINKKGGV